MTLREQQRKLSERLSETRKIIEQNIRDLIEKSTQSTIGKGAEKQIKSLQANIEKAFKLTMVGLNVATRDQIDFLNKRIELLNERLEVFAGIKPKSKSKKKKKGKGKAKKAKAEGASI